MKGREHNNSLKPTVPLQHEQGYHQAPQQRERRGVRACSRGKEGSPSAPQKTREMVGSLQLGVWPEALVAAMPSASLGLGLFAVFSAGDQWKGAR